MSLIVSLLLCKLGLHDNCYLGIVRVQTVKGPFDPDQKRTVEKIEVICAKCGKKKLSSFYDWGF